MFIAERQNVCAHWSSLASMETCKRFAVSGKLWHFTQPFLRCDR
jgi:hypothetical protein